MWGMWGSDPWKTHCCLLACESEKVENHCLNIILSHCFLYEPELDGTGATTSSFWVWSSIVDSSCWFGWSFNSWITFSRHFSSSCSSSGPKILSNRLGSEGGSGLVFEVPSVLSFFCESSSLLISVPSVAVGSSYKKREKEWYIIICFSVWSSNKYVYLLIILMFFWKLRTCDKRNLLLILLSNFHVIEFIYRWLLLYTLLLSVFSHILGFISVSWASLSYPWPQ
jgi:hypothetical protein